MGHDWSKFKLKYLEVFFFMNQVQMLPSGRKVAGAIRSLINARDLQLQCVRVLHEGLLVPILLYGSETLM